MTAKCLTGENVTYRLIENSILFMIEEEGSEILDIIIEVTLEKPVEMGVVDIFKDNRRIYIGR